MYKETLNKLDRCDKQESRSYQNSSKLICLFLKLLSILLSFLFSIILGFFFVLIILKIICCKCVECKADYKEKGGFSYYYPYYKEALLSRKNAVISNGFIEMLPLKSLRSSFTNSGNAKSSE